MTTSGTSTFNFNRDQIIKSAARKIGAIASGETPDAQTVSDFSDQLNTMVKSWASTGIHIWTETEATLFLQPGQVAYSLGSGSSDHCAETYTATTLASAASAGAVSISVSSATGFATTYNIGVVLDSGSIFWTTQNGAAVGTTIPLTGGLSGAAAAGNAVYVYAVNIIRPLRVVSTRRYNFASAIDTQVIPMSRIDYRNQPNKVASGVPTQTFYDPRGGANATGVLYVWPAPSDATNAIKLTWWRPLQDFTSAATNPDLPQEWLDALVWALALKMAPEYDCSPQRYEMIKDQAASALDMVMGFDREPESYFFGADMMNR